MRLPPNAKCAAGAGAPSRTRRLALTLALVAGAALFGTRATFAADEGSELLVRAGTVVPVGAPVLRDGAVLCRGGRIVAVGPASEVKGSPGAEVVDLGPHGVLLPGLVAASTGLASPGDGGPESVAPGVRALDGFDWFADRAEILAGGITTVHLDAARGRVIGGQGAVVKVAGAAPQNRTLVDSSGLFGAIGDPARNPPALFDAPSLPDPILHPLLPMRPQSPATRMAAVALLRGAFAPDRGGAPADEVGAAAVAAVLAKRSPVRIQAKEAADISAAVQVAKDLGLRLVLHDGRDIHRVIDLVAEVKASVVLTSPTVPGRIDRGDDPEEAARRDEAQRNPVLLAEREITFAVATSDEALPDLLLVAGSMARAGLSRERTLRAVTLDAARILEVDSRVGSIEVGKDADLAGFTGDPFDARTSCAITVIDGEIVWRRRDDASVLVLRAAAVHDGTGRVFAPGAVVIEGGKIVEAGPSVGIPPGARVVDEGHAVILPGIIDAHSRVGLRAGGAATSAGNLTTAASVLTAVAPDDASFAGALRAGITSVLITPGGDGMPSGTAAVVKTSGGTLEERTLRAAAGVELSIAGAGDLPGALQGMRDLFKRAKDYHERWEKYAKESEAYEKAVKEFEAAVRAREKEAKEKEANDKKAPPPAPAGGDAKDAAKKDEKPEEKKEEKKPEPKAPKEPDKPGLDPSLEPFRDILRKKAPVLVRASSPPEVAGALKVVVEEEKLILLVVQGEHAWRHAEALKKAGVGVLLGPNVVFEENGATVNAARNLSRAGVTFAIVSDAGIGASGLPMLAAWAVRHGLGPSAALRAITLDAATLLGVQDRVGSLEPGKDADLVVLSGDPFDAASSVRAVYIGGKVVGGE